MSSKNPTPGGTRISRRQFTTMCQIAIVPTIWPAMRLLEYVVDSATGYSHLHDRSSNSDSYGGTNVGVTALATAAVLRAVRSLGDPTVAKGLANLASSVQPDGGIYTPGTKQESYETCMAMMCLAEANGDGRYDRILRDADAFVKTCQWDEQRGQSRADMAYGGAGCGLRQRPDLSNTAFLVDAITSRHAGSSDPAVEKALVFVSRCQSVGESGSSPTAASDGGFCHACVAGSDRSISPRSCGVTTYSGLRSLLLAGARPDDPRVKAAMVWIRGHYDLASNPGMGTAGLYHYYHTFAKTLSLLGVDVIEDAAGVKHNWRSELCEQLVHRQSNDGSWINDNGCWKEDDSTVATAHALLAFSYCRIASESAPTCFAHSRRWIDRALLV
jgi:squalene-hopene/tetraprenyl-beta-curcumene cyclase